MNKILALLAALALGILALAAPASATGGDPSKDNKKITICHYDGSNNNGGSGKYSKITIGVSGWYGSGNGQSGHKSDTNDIWAAFSYTTQGGDVINVPAQGDTSRLAFDNCEIPKVDEKIAIPNVVFVDKCGTKNDTNLSVAPGLGYTVGALQINGQRQSITVTTLDGFVFTDGTKTHTFNHTFTAESEETCDLPETGAAAIFNTQGGIFAAIAGGFGLLMLLLYGRRQRA